MKIKNSPILAALACAAALRGAPLAQTAAVQIQPEDNAPVLTILKAGTEPLSAPLGQQAPMGWLAVSVAGPFDGYVLNTDLTKQLDVKPGAPIRLEPKPDAGILALGEKDEKTTLTGLHGAWTQIRLEKTVVGFIRTGAAPAPAESPVPMPQPGQATARDLSAPQPAAPSGTAFAGPQPAGDTSPAALGRPFEGQLASTRHPFTPRRPYDWELVDGSGQRFAYLDISKLLLTDQIGSFSNHGVVVFGTLKPVPGGKDLVIEVENLRLR